MERFNMLKLEHPKVNLETLAFNGTDSPEKHEMPPQPQPSEPQFDPLLAHLLSIGLQPLLVKKTNT